MTDEIRSLLNDSIAKIADGWISELKSIRDNTMALENQLLACVSKTKSNIEQLHTLGAQVAEEARRGRELCAKLSDGVAQIADEQLEIAS